MTREQLQKMPRLELVDWLEGARGMACYDDEPTKLLRETAIEDFDDCAKEEGFDDAA